MISIFIIGATIALLWLLFDEHKNGAERLEALLAKENENKQ